MTAAAAVSLPQSFLPVLELNRRIGGCVWNTPTLPFNKAVYHFHQPENGEHNPFSQRAGAGVSAGFLQTATELLAQL